MKLRVFTKETQDEWISQGYDSIKITASGHLSVNEEPEPYFLLERCGAEYSLRGH